MSKIKILRSESGENHRAYLFEHNDNTHNTIIELLTQLGFSDDDITQFDTPFTTLQGEFIRVTYHEITVICFFSKEKTWFLLEYLSSSKPQDILSKLHKYFSFGE
jgi:hypothetical protein